MIKKDTYVRIEKTILESSMRTSKIPEDTKQTPFKMWTKGFLLEDCSLNEIGNIRTVSGRIDSGKVIEENPMYELNYGEFVPEIIEIDEVLRNE